MPSYIITSPEGKRFKVSGEGTQAEALAHFQSTYQPSAQPEQKPQEIAQGLGRTALDQGLQGATFGFADELTDRLGAAGATAYSKIGRAFGADVPDINYFDALKDARGMSKERMAAQFEQNPVTAIGANLGGALLTGGAGATTAAGTAVANGLRSGGLLARVGKGALAGATSGAAFGAGGADDGQRLEGAGTGALYGGLTGGAIPAAGALVGSAGQGIKTATKGALARSPEAVQQTADSMRSAAGGLYNQMRQSGATFTGTSAQKLLADIDSSMKKQKFIAGLNPKTLAIVDDLREAVTRGDVGLDDLDQYRRMLGRIGNTEDGVSAGAVRRAIDDHVGNAGQADLAAGTASAFDMLKQGRAQYAQASKFDDVSDILTKADGDPNKIKAALTRFLNNSNNTKGWNQSEIDALKEAARNTTGEKLLKMGGKFGIDLGTSLTPGNTIAPLIGGAVTGGVAAPIAGTVARQGQKYLARGKAENLLDTIAGNRAAGAGRAISPLGSAPAGAAAGSAAQIPQAAPVPAMPQATPAMPTVAPQSSTSDYSQKLAMLESSGNPNAANSVTSAKGAAQFTDSTWQHMVQKYGKQYGLTMNGRNIKEQSDKAAELYAQENTPRLERALGRAPEPHELYLAHFLGAGGAAKLLTSDPRVPASQVLPTAASKNRASFFDKSGKPYSVAQFYNNIQKKWENA